MAQEIKDNVIYLDGKPVASTAQPNTPFKDGPNNFTPTGFQAPVVVPKPNVGKGIVSTTDYRSQIDSTMGAIDEITTDPYMQFFDQLRNQNIQAEETGIKQARADAAKEEKSVIDTQARYRAGLETLGIKSGLSQYAPSLQLDRMLQAENIQKAKLSEIDSEEKIAIAKAKAARAENDLDVMKEQLDYVQQLRKAKADAISEANKMAFEREKFEANYALDVRRENRLSAESKVADNFDFGQEVADLEDGDPGLMSYIRLYNSDPSKLTSIPQNIRDRVLAFADKVSEYDTALQINDFIEQRKSEGKKVNTNSVFKDLKDAYASGGVKLDGAQKKTLKGYIDKLLGGK